MRRFSADQFAPKDSHDEDCAPRSGPGGAAYLQVQKELYHVGTVTIKKPGDTVRSILAHTCSI